MVIHKLKTRQPYFDLVYKHRKTYEIRVNDRDFKAGDKVTLLEQVGGIVLPCRTIHAEIEHVCDLDEFVVPANLLQDMHPIVGLQLEAIYGEGMHIWKATSQCDLTDPNRETVKCAGCHVFGERSIDTGEVDYPCT